MYICIDREREREREREKESEREREREREREKESEREREREKESEREREGEREKEKPTMKFKKFLQDAKQSLHKSSNESPHDVNPQQTTAFRDIDIDELLFNMKFHAKQLDRLSRKSQSESTKEAGLCKQCIENNHREAARIHAENSIRKSNQAIQYQKLHARMETVASKLETHTRMNKTLTGPMADMVRGWESVMQGNDMDKMLSVLQRFPGQWEEVDVQSQGMESVMSQATAIGGTTWESQVDMLLQQIGDQHNLNVANAISAAASVPTQGSAASTQLDQQALYQTNPDAQGSVPVQSKSHPNARIGASTSPPPVPVDIQNLAPSTVGPSSIMASEAVNLNSIDNIAPTDASIPPKVKRKSTPTFKFGLTERIRNDESSFAKHPWEINARFFHQLYDKKFADIGLGDESKLRMMKMFFPPIHSETMVQKLDSFHANYITSWDCIYFLYHPQSSRFNDQHMLKVLQHSFIKDANIGTGRPTVDSAYYPRFVLAWICWEIFHPNLLTEQQKTQLNDAIMSDVLGFNSYAWKTMDYGIRDMTGANLNQEIEYIEMFRNLAWLYELQDVHADLRKEFFQIYHNAISGMPRMSLGDGAYRYNAVCETSLPYELRIINNLISLWTHSYDPSEIPDQNYIQSNKSLRDQIREKANMFLLGTFQEKAEGNLQSNQTPEIKTETYLPLVITSAYPYYKYQNTEIVDRWTAEAVYLLAHMLEHPLLIHNGPAKTYLTRPENVKDEMNKFYFLMYIHLPHIDEKLLQATPEQSPLFDNYAYFNRNYLGGMGKYGNYAYLINGRTKVDVDSDLYYHRNTSVGFLVSKGTKNNAWSSLSTIQFLPGIKEDMETNQYDCFTGPDCVNSTINTSEFASLGQTMKKLWYPGNRQFDDVTMHEIWITTQKGAIGLMICDTSADRSPDKKLLMRMNGTVLENCGSRKISYCDYCGGDMQGLDFMNNTIVNGKLEIKIHNTSIDGSFKILKTLDQRNSACIAQHCFTYQEPYDSSKKTHHMLVGIKSVDTVNFTNLNHVIRGDHIILSFNEGDRKYIVIYNPLESQVLDCKMLDYSESSDLLFWMVKSGAKYRPECLTNLEITGEWMLLPEVAYGAVQQKLYAKSFEDIKKGLKIPGSGHVVLMSAVGEVPRTGGPGFETELPVAYFPFYTHLNMAFEDLTGNMIMSQHDNVNFEPGWAVFNGNGYLEARVAEDTRTKSTFEKSVCFWIEPDLDCGDIPRESLLYYEDEWLKIKMKKDALVINEEIQINEVFKSRHAVHIGLVVEGTRYSVYINGFRTYMNDNCRTCPEALGRIFLGRGFAGRLGHVMVFDQVITRAEIKVLCTRTQPRGYNEMVFQKGGLPVGTYVWLNNSYFSQHSPTNRPIRDLGKYLYAKKNVLLIEGFKCGQIFEKPSIIVGGYRRKIIWRITAFGQNEVYSAMKQNYLEYERDETRKKQDRFMKYYELEFRKAEYDDRNWATIEFDSNLKYEIPAYDSNHSEIFIRGEFTAIAVDVREDEKE